MRLSHVWCKLDETRQEKMIRQKAETAGGVVSPKDVRYLTGPDGPGSEIRCG